MWCVVIVPGRSVFEQHKEGGMFAITYCIQHNEYLQNTSAHEAVQTYGLLAQGQHDTSFVRKGCHVVVIAISMYVDSV